MEEKNITPQKYCPKCQHIKDLIDTYCKHCETKLELRNSERFPRTFIAWCKMFWVIPTSLTVILGAVLGYLIYLTITAPVLSNNPIATFYLLLATDIAFIAGIIALWVVPYIGDLRELKTKGKVELTDGSYMI